MMTLQFILYNLTFLSVIAHFLDSAKEQEWTDFLYKGSYTGWLISSILLIAEVCHNGFSYGIMVVLSIFCLLLAGVTLLA